MRTGRNCSGTCFWPSTRASSIVTTIDPLTRSKRLRGRRSPKFWESTLPTDWFAAIAQRLLVGTFRTSQAVAGMSAVEGEADMRPQIPIGPPQFGTRLLRLARQLRENMQATGKADTAKQSNEPHSAFRCSRASSAALRRPAIRPTALRHTKERPKAVRIRAHKGLRRSPQAQEEAIPTRASSRL